jgi:XTP/dITP diphosphohydrolase
MGFEVLQLKIEYPELQADRIEHVAEFGLQWIGENSQLFIEKYEFFPQLEFICLEDAGLFVHGLNNFPGVYSKFVFETVGCKGIIELLKSKSDRTAHFEACIALAKVNFKLDTNTIELNNFKFFKGVSNGLISQEPKGDKGFGYDPIFIADGTDRTFAEMESQEKNKYSHRGSAMDKLVDFLNTLTL